VEHAAATRREPSQSRATTAATNWRAAKVAAGVDAVVVAVSDPADSVADIAARLAAARAVASGAAVAVASVAVIAVAVIAVAEDSAALSEAVDRPVEPEVEAVAAAVVVATTEARAAPKFRSISPFFRLIKVFFLSSA